MLGTGIWLLIAWSNLKDMNCTIPDRERTLVFDKMNNPIGTASIHDSRIRFNADLAGDVVMRISDDELVQLSIPNSRGLNNSPADDPSIQTDKTRNNSTKSGRGESVKGKGTKTTKPKEKLPPY